MGGMHHGEGTGRRINNQITQLCNSGDQSPNQTDRLDMRMNFTINLLRPAAWDSVIAPVLCGDWRFLQNQQVVAAPTRALAHANSKTVPGNQVYGCERFAGNAEVVSFTHAKRID